MVQYGMCREHGQQFSSTWSRAAGDSSSGCLFCSLLPSFAKSVRSTITTTQTRHGVGKRGEADRGRQALEQASRLSSKAAGGRGGRDWQRC